MDFSEFRNLKFNVLGDSSFIKGSLVLKGDVTIASSIEGDVCVLEEGKTTIERSGSINGELKAFDVEIFGKFNGKLEAQGKLTIRSSAEVSGQIKAQDLCIYPGAHLEMEAHTQD